MRLIMAVSNDGYVAQGPKDDMSWTGDADKRAFRLLTSVGGGVCGVGSTTFDLMPKLKGRKLWRLTSSPGDHGGHQGLACTLGWFAHSYPGAWLLGGPTLAQAAFDIGLIDEAFFCVIQGIDLELEARDDEDGLVPEQLRLQMARRSWGHEVVYKHGGLKIERWHRG